MSEKSKTRFAYIVPAVLAAIIAIAIASHFAKLSRGAGELVVPAADKPEAPPAITEPEVTREAIEWPVVETSYPPIADVARQLIEGAPPAPAAPTPAKPVAKRKAVVRVPEPTLYEQVSAEVDSALSRTRPWVPETPLGWPQ